MKIQYNKQRNKHLFVKENVMSSMSYKLLDVNKIYNMDCLEECNSAELMSKIIKDDERYKNNPDLIQNYRT